LDFTRILLQLIYVFNGSWALMVYWISVPSNQHYVNAV